MGLWDKWLVKNICKQALKENTDPREAVKASFTRINKDLLTTRSDNKRRSKMYGYLIDVWKELTGNNPPSLTLEGEKWIEKIKKLEEK